ncbi:MAG: O-antigen ligase family protein [Proteobacteria bacterium]|nr:O-antigen ligase family protein [Pseudomonadota bacterium]MBU4328808.1 O-antigen ligase family protein [Pseudomonadota bacterium]
MSRIILSKNISEVFSKGLFVVFYMLLLVEAFAILQNSSTLLSSTLVVATFFLATLFSPFWAIWFFVAVIPLINGFFVMKGVGDISLAFAGVYLAWLPQQLIKNKSFQSSSSAVFFANLLATIVFFNIFLVYVRILEFPIPSRLWFDWFTYFPFAGQKDNLWQINASLILLQGIFLFKMLDIELINRNYFIFFTKVVYAQAIFIIAFSLIQLVNFKIRGENYLGIYLPFNDIHSYGSYVVLLLGVFTAFFLNSLTIRREYQPDKKQEKDHLAFLWFDVSRIIGLFYKLSFKTVVNGFLAVSFFFLCCYSSSRMTWLAMGVILFFLVIVAIRNKKIITCFGIIIVLITIISSLFVPQLLQSNNPSLYRLGSFLNVKNFNKDENLLIRFELWKRSLKMAKDYPLTGVGLGNFYRTNVHYKNNSMGRWDSENTHNYYLQVLAELGVPGLILFLVLLSSLYSRRVTVAVREGDGLSPEFSVKPFCYGLGAYLLTMLTGHPLLLSSQQFLFWAIVAIISKGHFFVLGEDERVLPEYKIPKIVGAFIFFLFVLGFSKNLYKHEPWTIPVEYGLYPTENWDGGKMRWMAGKAEYYLPETTRELNLKIVAQPFNSQKPEGLTLIISINDSVVDKVHFIEGGTKNLSYNISSINKQDIKVNLEVDKVFCPKTIGLNSDFRILGVALGLDD